MSTTTKSRNHLQGDGYWCPTHLTECFRSCDQRRWGRFGAAGVLFRYVDTDGQQWFMLNQRSHAIHHGGTWSVLGGAIDGDETPIEGGLREAREEIGTIPADFSVLATVTDNSAGGWTYTTIIVDVDRPFSPRRHDWESIGSAWFTLNQISVLRLHPAFRASFPAITRALYFAEDQEIV